MRGIRKKRRGRKYKTNGGWVRKRERKGEGRE